MRREGWDEEREMERGERGGMRREGRQRREGWEEERGKAKERGMERGEGWKGQ